MAKSWIEPLWILSRCLCILVAAVNLDACTINLHDANCQNLFLTKFPHIHDKDVTSINVSYNSINRLDAYSLWDLERLLHVDASENHIRVIEPGSFHNHSSLITLILEHNMLSEFDVSSTFSPISELQELNLKDNQLTFINIVNLQNLRLLDLTKNLLETLTISSANMRSLKKVYLTDNKLKEILFPKTCSEAPNSIEELILNDNHIEDVTFLMKCRFSSLATLNLANNRITFLQQDGFMNMPHLNMLVLDGNPLASINGFTFNGLQRLRHLQLNNLSHLINVSKDALFSLSVLNHLEISGSKKLCSHQHLLFNDLTELQYLDMSHNSLTHVDLRIFNSLKGLEFLNLSSNTFTCDCWTSLFTETLLSKISDGMNLLDRDSMTCMLPEELKDTSVWMAPDKLKCTGMRPFPHDIQKKERSFKLGSTAVLDCDGFDNVEHGDYVWLKINGKTSVATSDGINSTSSTHSWYHVLANGSLKFPNVRSSDVGVYVCYATPWKALGEIVHVKLDFGILRRTQLMSMLVGLITSASFFVLSILFGGIKVCSRTCSEKEKNKKTSMQEVLNSLRTNIPLDRFQSYRSAQIERFTAFRSATFEQLSAFKSARVSRLRKYKQASVNGILHCLDRMRIHYSNQSVKIKLNCQQQFDRLRESYICQKLRPSDNRSQHVRKIRDNYHSQALKIKDYGSRQMSRLREQYKHQQQNLMKLLELLEVGNCIIVIEEECSKTESIIFDSDIADCELDARPDLMEPKDDRDSCDDVFESSPSHDNVILPQDPPIPDVETHPLIHNPPSLDLGINKDQSDSKTHFIDETTTDV